MSTNEDWAPDERLPWNRFELTLAGGIVACAIAVVCIVAWSLS